MSTILIYWNNFNIPETGIPEPVPEPMTRPRHLTLQLLIFIQIQDEHHESVTDMVQRGAIGLAVTREKTIACCLDVPEPGEHIQPGPQEPPTVAGTEVNQVMAQIKSKLNTRIKFSQIKGQLLIWMQAKKTEGFSYEDITRMLNSAGVPTARTGNWCRSTVKTMMD
ncbi:MAG: recombinase family protein [Deltaproteobacteria bacterium]|nr:recombinase family protein [Deltaproteobacteria bacterium]